MHPRAKMGTIDPRVREHTNLNKFAKIVQQLFSMSDSEGYYCPLMYTGATDHMAGNKSMLSGFSITSQSHVCIANGSACNIEGIGSTEFSKHLPLSPVLYVLSFPENLMYFSKIIEQLN